MTKNFIKEIIIILLLTIAIILISGVLLYEYVPAKKIIPEKISYTTPEEAKNELETNVDESEEDLYVDYHIDSTQLSNYKKIQEYVPGKKNPFETLEKNSNTTADNNNNTQSSTKNNGDTTSSGENTVSNENTEGYLPDKGIK